MDSKKNILLVDDDSIYLFIAQKIINKILPDAIINTCKNGQEAISLMDSLNPDIMFLDINMPVLNGWDLLDKLINQKINFPIFIVSSSIDEKDKAKAKSYVDLVKGYISKPLNADKLKSLID